MITRRQAAAALASAPWAAGPARAQAPPDLSPMLAQRLAVAGVGLVAATVGRSGTRFGAAGRSAAGDSAAPDEHTLFEIGSVSKTFTALLLADAVVRRELALDEPVEASLPGGLKLRDVRGAPICFVDLATHRSGLPRGPLLAHWLAREDPFGGFVDSDLLRYLARWRPEVERGARFGYSNLGSGLLGWLLARRAGRSYIALLAERVLAPLALDAVFLVPPPAAQARLARPHAADGSPAPPIDFGVLAPAAGLVASAAALARYAEVMLGLVEHPLQEAVALCMRQHAEGPSPALRMGLGWFIAPFGRWLLFFHEGITPGGAASLVLHPAWRRGALVLGNARVPVQDLALHALDPSRPLNAVPPAAAASVPE